MDKLTVRLERLRQERQKAMDYPVDYGERAEVIRALDDRIAALERKMCTERKMAHGTK